MYTSMGYAACSVCRVCLKFDAHVHFVLSECRFAAQGRACVGETAGEEPALTSRSTGLPEYTFAPLMKTTMSYVPLSMMMMMMITLARRLKQAS